MSEHLVMLKPLTQLHVGRGTLFTPARCSTKVAAVVLPLPLPPFIKACSFGKFLTTTDVAGQSIVILSLSQLAWHD